MRKKKFRMRKKQRKKENPPMSATMMMMMMMGTPPVMTEVMVTMKMRSDPFWRLMPKGEKEQGTLNSGGEEKK